MNRSSILRLSGILAAVAFALSFLVGAFNSLGGLVVLSRLGLDDRVMSRISAGENLLISVLLVAAFVVLSMDKENLAAGLIGAIRSGIYCIFAFGWLIGVPLISGRGIYFQSLVYIALAVMLFLSVVFIKNNVPRTLRFLAIAAVAYMVVSQLIWQGVNVYCMCSGVSAYEMSTIYRAVSFFTTLPSLMCIAVLTVYFIAQARTGDRCQASCDDGAYLPPQQ